MRHAALPSALHLPAAASISARLLLVYRSGRGRTAHSSRSCPSLHAAQRVHRAQHSVGELSTLPRCHRCFPALLSADELRWCASLEAAGNAEAAARALQQTAAVTWREMHAAERVLHDHRLVAASRDLQMPTPIQIACASANQQLSSQIERQHQLCPLEIDERTWRGVLGHIAGSSPVPQSVIRQAAVPAGLLRDLWQVQARAASDPDGGTSALWRRAHEALTQRTQAAPQTNWADPHLPLPGTLAPLVELARHRQQAEIALWSGYLPANGAPLTALARTASLSQLAAAELNTATAVALRRAITAVEVEFAARYQQARQVDLDRGTQVLCILGPVADRLWSDPLAGPVLSRARALRNGDTDAARLLVTCPASIMDWLISLAQGCVRGSATIASLPGRAPAGALELAIGEGQVSSSAELADMVLGCVAAFT